MAGSRMIDVDVFARRENVAVADVIARIKDGTYPGKAVDGKWSVAEDAARRLRRPGNAPSLCPRVKLEDVAPEARPPATAPHDDPPDGPYAVVVVDVLMPFDSMVVFMGKWAIASIHALMALAAVFFAVAALVVTVFSVFGT